METMIEVTVRGVSRTVAKSQALDTATELGANADDRPTFREVKYSEFGDGKQISDSEALARIQQQHAALAAGGITVDTSQQLYATGTRMMEEGYATQEARRQAHLASKPAAEAIEELRSRILREQRTDVEVTARDLGRHLSVDGAVRFCGMVLQEQAIRGLAGRLKSPMFSYALGLSARNNEGDAQQLANLLQYECDQAPETLLKLRCRKGVGADVFACVSPSYTSADMPEVAGDLLDALPAEARGTWQYDPGKTDWNLRLDVWTPTPVAEQAVGEAFSGFVNIHGRDNGTGRISGGGGIELLRCLNASVYTADGVDVSRVHRANVMVNLQAMLRKSAAAVDVLCQAWGINREVEVPTPEGVAFSREISAMMFRGLLTDRKSLLVGVLPGRTEVHVERLAETFDSERRCPVALVRSDVAQAWTRYSQKFTPAVQYEAQTVIGNWLVTDKRPLTFVEK